METLIGAALIAGAVVWLVGAVWFLVVAFRQHVLWGLGSLFVPFVALVFLIMHWRKALLPAGVYLLGFVLVAGGTAAACGLAFRIDIVNGDAMYPSHPTGSRVFALRQPYATAAITRGSVILFERHQRPKGTTSVFISRVIGLPGDTVEIDGDRVLLNGKELPREEVRTDGELTIWQEHNGAASYPIALGPEGAQPAPLFGLDPITLGQGEFFVLGDNRNKTEDSRSFGPIRLESVVGKVW
jgi:signal peptidase I